MGDVISKLTSEFGANALCPGKPQVIYQNTIENTSYLFQQARVSVHDIHTAPVWYGHAKISVK